MVCQLCSSCPRRQLQQPEWLQLRYCLPRLLHPPRWWHIMQSSHTQGPQWVQVHEHRHPQHSQQHPSWLGGTHLGCLGVGSQHGSHVSAARLGQRCQQRPVSAAAVVASEQVAHLLPGPPKAPCTVTTLRAGQRLIWRITSQAHSQLGSILGPACGRPDWLIWTKLEHAGVADRHGWEVLIGSMDLGVQTSDTYKSG